MPIQQPGLRASATLGIGPTLGPATLKRLDQDQDQPRPFRSGVTIGTSIATRNANCRRSRRAQTMKLSSCFLVVWLSASLSLLAEDPVSRITGLSITNGLQ